jgi:hypothetical protein
MTSPDVDASSAAAPDASADELLARLKAAVESAEAREAEASPEPEAADNTVSADSNAPAWLHDILAKVEARLSALEGK